MCVGGDRPGLSIGTGDILKWVGATITQLRDLRVQQVDSLPWSNSLQSAVNRNHVGTSCMSLGLWTLAAEGQGRRGQVGVMAHGPLSSVFPALTHIEPVYGISLI